MSNLFPRWPENTAVLRARSATFALWVFALIGAYFLVDAAVRGRWDVVVVALPWILLVLWGVWALAYRPVVAYDENGVTVRNILREHHFGWAQVRDITDRFQFVFLLHDGTKVKAWGGPVTGPAGGRKLFGRREGVNAGVTARTPLDDINDTRVEGRANGTAAYTVSWALVPIVSGAVLIIWALFTLLLS